MALDLWLGRRFTRPVLTGDAIELGGLEEEAKTTQIQLKELPSLGGGTHIERALQVIRGVRDVQVQPDAGRVTVEHENVDENELVQAVAAAGVAAELIPENAEVVAPSVPPMEGKKNE